MHKLIFIAALFIGIPLSLHSWMGTAYVPCNDMPATIQNYYADVTALNRVHTVGGSPEKRKRYKKLVQDFIIKLNLLTGLQELIIVSVISNVVLISFLI